MCRMAMSLNTSKKILEHVNPILSIGTWVIRLSQLKLFTMLVLLIVSIGCMNHPQNFRPLKLPSGKEIKVTSVVKMDFPQSGSALVMNYLTDISVDEKQALRE